MRDVMRLESSSKSDMAARDHSDTPLSSDSKGRQWAAVILTALSVGAATWVAKVLLGPLVEPAILGLALLIALFVLMLVEENIARTSRLRSAMRLGIAVGILLALLVLRYT